MWNAVHDRMIARCQQIEAEVLLHYGCRVKLLFDIKNIAEVTVNQCRQTIDVLSKWDVRGCFPSLPLNDPHAGLLTAFAECFEWACDNDKLWIHTKGCMPPSWHTPPEKS